MNNILVLSNVQWKLKLASDMTNSYKSTTILHHFFLHNTVLCTLKSKLITGYRNLSNRE